MITCLTVGKDLLRVIVLKLRVIDAGCAPASLSLAPLTLARVSHEPKSHWKSE